MVLPFLRSTLGLSGLEPPTSRLSGVRSNRLSYTPIFEAALTICHQFPDHILDLAFSFEFPLQDPQN